MKLIVNSLVILLKIFKQLEKTISIPIIYICTLIIISMIHCYKFIEEQNI